MNENHTKTRTMAEEEWAPFTARRVLEREEVPAVPALHKGRWTVFGAGTSSWTPLQAVDATPGPDLAAFLAEA